MKWICLLTSTDLTDSNNLAIMNASAIGHHCKEDGSSQEEEAEHTQHYSIQGMGKNLKKILLKMVVNNAVFDSCRTVVI